jgi:hypothetical protein
MIRRAAGIAGFQSLWLLITGWAKPGSLRHRSAESCLPPRDTIRLSRILTSAGKRKRHFDLRKRHRRD